MSRSIFSLIVVLIAFVSSYAPAQLSTSDRSLHLPPITIDGTAVIQPRTMAMYVPPASDNALVPEITIIPIDETGYDIRYTFRNDTDRSHQIGRLCIGTLALGENIQYLNVHRGSRLSNAKWSTYIGQGWRYPLDAYSPVTALMNDNYAVGVSLLYPLLEYKHDVLVRVMRAGGVFKGPSAGLGWAVAFDLSNVRGVSRHSALTRQASLAPGQERSYTVAVRVLARAKRNSTSASGPQDWLETLLPYRDYFQDSFGPVEYTRNDEPVLARELANIAAVGQRNPRGFMGTKDTRPDLVGFGPVAQQVAGQQGFGRVMLWAPSGIYATNRKNNFPPQFTLGWNDIPLLHSTSHRLKIIPQSGKQLGLWWGRSTQYTTTWDPAQLETISLTNPEHVRSISRQLSMAQDSGATIIGMDNLIHTLMPVWDQIKLIRAVRKVFPDLTMVAEPMCCDIVHSVTPAFFRAFHTPSTARTEEDFHKYKGPNYLADFLLPGHETWAYFRYSEINRVSRMNITATRIQRDASRLARNGFVPVIITKHPLGNPSIARAEETWKTTVPRRLQQEPPPPTTDP